MAQLRVGVQLAQRGGNAPAHEGVVVDQDFRHRARHWPDLLDGYEQAR